MKAAAIDANMATNLAARTRRFCTFLREFSSLQHGGTTAPAERSLARFGRLSATVSSADAERPLRRRCHPQGVRVRARGLGQCLPPPRRAGLWVVTGIRPSLSQHVRESHARAIGTAMLTPPASHAASDRSVGVTGVRSSSVTCLSWYETAAWLSRVSTPAASTTVPFPRHLPYFSTKVALVRRPRPSIENWSSSRRSGSRGARRGSRRLQWRRNDPVRGGRSVAVSPWREPVVPR